MDVAEAAFQILRRVPAGARRVLPPETRADLRRRLGHWYPWEDGFDFTPPPAEGRETGPPDFVGVGAPHCGTVWWYRHLESHASVAGRGLRPVGLHYFSHFARREFTAADRARYGGWFARRPGQLAGEWTSAYAAEPWVAPLLPAGAPDARLLFLVRDPVDRLEAGLTGIASARAANDGATMAEEMERGFYARQLRRLLEFVPSDRVLVLQLERCLDDRAGQLATTFRFLGLEPTTAPPDLRPWPAAPAGPPLDPSAAARAADVYREDAKDLASLVPDLDLDRWPRLRAGLGRGRGPSTGR